MQNTLLYEINITANISCVCWSKYKINTLHGKGIGKGKGHPCTGTEALYRPYGAQWGRGIALLFLNHGTIRG